MLTLLIATATAMVASLENIANLVFIGRFLCLRYVCLVRIPTKSKFHLLLDVAALLLPSCDSYLRNTSRLLDTLLVRSFHAASNVLVAVIGFVNLLHAIKRFFLFTHSLVNKAETIDNFLLHRVHRRNFFRRVFQLIHRKIEHLKLPIAPTQKIHCLQACIWILSCALQFRQGLAKTSCIHQVLAELKPQLQVGRVPFQAFARVAEQNFCAFSFSEI